MPTKMSQPNPLNPTAELAIRLLSEWMADESGYDEGTWPELKTALDQDRLSFRRLFDE